MARSVLARYDAFLSYSREDQAIVRELAEQLRSRGYRLFFDQESIKIGENWKQRLEVSIRQSRTLILCWSKCARTSEFTQFEYMRALAAKIPVFPWLLDETALPSMLDIQAVTTPEAVQAAGQLSNRLGWTVSRRKAWSMTAAAVVVLAGSEVAALRFNTRVTYEFHGEVTDTSNLPLAGVTVTAGDVTVLSDEKGRYTLVIPGERPASLQLRFNKAGYEPEGVIAATGTTFPFAMNTSK